MSLLIAYDHQHAYVAYRCLPGHHWKPGPSQFRLIKRHSYMRFGRRADCEVQWSNPDVSQIQFEIRDQDLLVLSTTNPTFVDGKRVEKARLNTGSLIQFSCHLVAVYPSFLIVSQTGEDETIQSSCQKIEQLPIPKEKLIIDIQLPRLNRASQLPSWFQTIGSSMMILASSAATLFFVKVGPAMIFSSISMALAFLVYGLVNRQITVKQIKQEGKQDHQLYLDYLDQEAQKAQAAIDLLREQEQAYASLCRLCHPDLIGWQHPYVWDRRKIAYCEIVSHQIAYQDLHHPLIEARNQVIQWLEKPHLRYKIGPLEDGYIRVIDDLFFQCLYQGIGIEVEEDVPKLIKPLLCQNAQVVFSQRSKPQYENRIWIQYEQGFQQPEPYVHYWLAHQQKKCRFAQLIAQAKPGFELALGFNGQQVVWVDGREFHALIAGMTGSGKSSLVASFLLQMVTKNPPSAFQYILVDFKGGAFGQAFYDFPHCAGHLTNLENYQVDRFMASLSSELRQRQIILQQQAVTHIDDARGLAHLWIIFDEFAQFKQQHPDDMDRLKEMARIGRSLGIHLILSTQKPMGVVDEQIWANAKMRACFMVQSRADSMEVLHESGAQDLSTPGQAIILFGQTRYHVQSFWCEEAMTSTKPYLGLSAPDVETVLQHYAPKGWQPHYQVVLPKLSNQDLGHEHFIWVDDPHHQKQYPLSFDRLLVIGATTQFVNLALSHGYGLSKSGQKDIWITDQYLPHYVGPILICQWSNLDLIRLYTKASLPSSFQEENEGYYLEQDRAYRVFLCKGEKKVIRKGIEIGKEGVMPVLWCQERPLLVLYIQPDMAFFANQLAQIKQVYCMNLALNIPTDQQVYSMDILWLGLGLEQYGYLLKRTIPIGMSGHVFFSEQEVYRIDHGSLRDCLSRLDQSAT